MDSRCYDAHREWCAVSSGDAWIGALEYQPSDADQTWTHGVPQLSQTIALLSLYVPRSSSPSGQ